MGIVNQALGALFEGLLMPFRSLPAWVALAVLSLVTSVGVLIVYKKTSNQAAIDLVKRKIQANFYEIRLFNDDLRAILRAQTLILRYNAVYLGLNFVPMLVMIVPFTFIIAQLQSHYGWTGLTPNEAVLVKAQLSDDWEQNAAISSVDGKPSVTLHVPASMTVETKSVWIPTTRELAWRIVPREAGEFEIALESEAQLATKQLFVAEGRGRRSPVRQQAGFVHELLFPAEETIPADSPVQSIEVIYPDRSIDLFGYTLATAVGIPAWMIVYFTLSMVFAFALKGRFGVTI